MPVHLTRWRRGWIAGIAEQQSGCQVVGSHVGEALCGLSRRRMLVISSSDSYQSGATTEGSPLHGFYINRRGNRPVQNRQTKGATAYFCFCAGAVGSGAQYWSDGVRLTTVTSLSGLMTYSEAPYLLAAYGVQL